MPKVKIPKKMELEDLARMMADGFTELKGEMDERFSQIDKKFELVFDDSRLIKADIHDIKNTLGPLVLMMGMNDTEIKKVNLRLTRLEKFVGITGK